MHVRNEGDRVENFLEDENAWENNCFEPNSTSHLCLAKPCRLLGCVNTLFDVSENDEKRKHVPRICFDNIPNI